MLKIKDNVDLKELEKFGFKYTNDYEWQSVKAYIKIYEEYEITVTDYDNSIEIYFYKFTSDIGGIGIPTVIYDLIKADLVEKVSDENE